MFGDPVDGRCWAELPNSPLLAVEIALDPNADLAFSLLEGSVSVDVEFPPNRSLSAAAVLPKVEVEFAVPKRQFPEDGKG